MQKQKILICEDESSIAGMIAAILEVNGYEPIIASAGKQAYSLIASHCPDMVILDLGLPDVDGMEILRKVRTWTPLPIVVVSARANEQDKVLALDAGADDYITKPFGTSELMARVRTALRHTRTTASLTPGSMGPFHADGLVIDYDKRRVTVGGEECHLTANEYRILALLSRFAGKVMTYDAIIRELWGPNAGVDNQNLRVHMANIRRKIEKNPATPMYIFTEVGVGYRMLDADNAASES